MNPRPPFSHRATLVVCFSVAACSGHGSRTRHPLPALARGSSAHFSHPPTIDGSRGACLQPPYTPATDANRLSDGMPVARLQNGRQWILSLEGESVPSPAQASALVERLRARGGPLRWISYGLYCGSAAPDGLCLSYEGNLCEMRIEESARLITAAIAADTEMPRPRIRLSLTLAGRLGPRCEPGSTLCGPVAYEHDAPPPANCPRHLGPLAEYSIGSCRHDGDCVVGGCGNHCMSWEYGGAHEGATCEGYVFDRPVYCGCVDGACGWFRQ